MTSAIEVVRFQGDAIQAVREGEQVWVVVKRVCEALGVDEEPQRKKLKNKAWAATSFKEVTGPDGKNYESFCLSLDSLPMWLAGIEPSRVRAEVRSKLIAYQRECANVLRDHFFGRRTAEGMFPAAMIGNIVEPLLERQNQHFLVLMRSFDSRTALLEQRVADIERGSDRIGAISPATHKRIQGLVRRIAEKEVLLKRWPSLRGAQRDVYREIGELTGWGGKAQKWSDLPGHCESPVMVALTRRLIDAERHADRLLARQLDMFSATGSGPN